MLFLETFLNGFDDASRIAFINALRYRGLYQDSLAVQLIFEIAQATGIEELYILAYEWNLRINSHNVLANISNISFKNPVLRDFIFLQVVRTTDSAIERRRMIGDFLNNNPQNVFSPQLRLLLFRANERS
jgi:hypothetical protein